MNRSLRFAELLGGHAWETLALLTGIVVLLALCAPALAGALYSALLERFPRAGRLLERGYSSISLYFVAGILLAIACLNLFRGLAETVHESPVMKAFDHELAESYRRQVTPTEIAFFRTVTLVGGLEATWAIGLGVGLLLLLQRRRSLLLVWVAGLVGNSLLNAALKAVFERARPALADPLLLERNYSFPSGHAMASVVIYGLLAYVLALIFPVVLARACILLTLLIGLSVGMSRMVLGVHYFSDVFAGWVVGLGWLAVVLTGAEFWRRRASPGFHDHERE